MAPLAVQAAPNPDPSPVPDPLPVPQPVPEPEAKDMVVPAVPALMGWIGSIGGLLGIISFTETYITKIINAINKEVKKAEEKKEKAPWAVAVAVGLDGSGLKVQFVYCGKPILEKHCLLLSRCANRQNGGHTGSLTLNFTIREPKATSPRSAYGTHMANC